MFEFNLLKFGNCFVFYPSVISYSLLQLSVCNLVLFPLPFIFLHSISFPPPLFRLYHLWRWLLKCKRCSPLSYSPHIASSLIMSFGVCRYATCVIPISAFFAASLWYVMIFPQIISSLLAFTVLYATSETCYLLCSNC